MDLWVRGSIQVPSRASPMCNLDRASASVLDLRVMCLIFKN